MADKIIIGPISKGFKTNLTPFNIDNDSFPVLVNAYQWRGRIKRKRGTSLINRLTKGVSTISIGVTGASPWTFNIFSVIGLKGNITGITNAAIGEVTTLDNHNLTTGDNVLITGVTGMTQVNNQTFTITVTAVNKFTIGISTLAFGVYGGGGLWTNITEPNATIRPGSVVITIAGPIVFTDQGDGTLTSPTPGNSGTINYLTGVIVLTHTAGAGVAVTASFAYYPTLPVMGLEDLVLDATEYPGNIAFDTRYAYNMVRTFPYNIYNVSYYKNPATAFGAYAPKTTPTPFHWNGQDYQQFWTTNYQGAFWATNGVTVPFNVANIGMQFVLNGTIVWVNANKITIDYATAVPVLGDFVFLNEITTNSAVNTEGKEKSINLLAGVVTAVVGATRTIEFTGANIIDPATGDPGKVYQGGITQLLTNNSDATKDVIRWYDGDPTNGNPLNPGFINGKGWVNFMPPLSQSTFGIADLPPAKYYLVGGRMIVPFKDRLLILGPVVQSSTGSPIYLQDTVIYSQNGTPYYTSGFNGDPALATTTFTPVLVPINQTATASAWWEDTTGFGGFISSGLNDPILTVDTNEDVLIVGFRNQQTRLIYTGNDVVPFNFYSVNSELGSVSTFSSINMDEGTISRGSRGYILTSQTRAERIDVEIPDRVFKIRNLQNGNERFTAVRDYINEWIYFTYPFDDIAFRFPTQTLQYNYRENTWAIFFEAYTTYGTFRKIDGYTWATIGTVFPTWSEWNLPWNAGGANLLRPKIIAGTSQGFVVERDDGTGEANSIAIQSISGNIVTSPDHLLNNEDFIVISGALGTIGAEVNNKIFQVYASDTNTFRLKPSITGTGTYLGGGLIKRMYVPFIQTKQFPTGWGLARKTRIGPQQYLFTKTSSGQVTVSIFLSMNPDDAYNTGVLFPNLAAYNDALVYSQTVFTCPESTNLGLTPANINLNEVTGKDQVYIWHRMNTSLLGDVVQIGISLSDEQMTDDRFSSQFAEIELHSMILEVSPSQLLA